MPLNTKHRLIPSLGINSYISMLMGAALGATAPPRRPAALFGAALCVTAAAGANLAKDFPPAQFFRAVHEVGRGLRKSFELRVSAKRVQFRWKTYISGAPAGVPKYFFVILPRHRLAEAAGDVFAFRKALNPVFSNGGSLGGVCRYWLGIGGYAGGLGGEFFVALRHLCIHALKAAPEFLISLGIFALHGPHIVDRVHHPNVQMSNDGLLTSTVCKPQAGLRIFTYWRDGEIILANRAIFVVVRINATAGKWMDWLIDWMGEDFKHVHRCPVRKGKCKW
jgi:hypothetical protein